MRKLLCYLGSHKWDKIKRIPAQKSSHNIMLAALIEDLLMGENEHIIYECQCCKKQKKLYI